MKEGQTRKTRTGNYITYRKISIVDDMMVNSHEMFKVYLSCGHFIYMKDTTRDRLKLFIGLIGCYKCGATLNTGRKS